jgi:hypothetical protein
MHIRVKIETTSTRLERGEDVGGRSLSIVASIVTKGAFISYFIEDVECDLMGLRSHS